MKCRIIGGMKAEQSEKKGKEKMIRNDRFIAIPDASSIFENITSMSDLPGNIMKQLENFFVNYIRAEGKEFKVLKQLNPKEAIELIDA